MYFSLFSVFPWTTMYNVCMFDWFQVTVQPIYEPGGDKEDGWGEFDCEILDRKVAYMVG